MNEEKKTFSCVLCDGKLESKEALQEHFRKHANKEIDAKGKASKIVAPKTSEENKNKTEEQSHKSNSKIACDVCSMEFDTISLAIQHKFRKHPTSSSKYFCPFCGMQFPIKFTRDKHVETHKDEPTNDTFPCPDCGIIFYNTKAQNYHFKSTHKKIMSLFKPVPTPPPSKKIKINNLNEAQSVYYCYLCGMEYVIKYNLQLHLERSHTDEERNKVPEDLIKCTTCDALFYRKKAYENHNMYHKPDDLYVTSEEQRLQIVTRVDQDFDIRRVQAAASKFLPHDKPKNRRKTSSSTLPKKVKKNNATDDELSPTSSVGSSDSEDEEKEKEIPLKSEKTDASIESSEDAVNECSEKSKANQKPTITQVNNIKDTINSTKQEKLELKKQPIKKTRKSQNK